VTKLSKYVVTTKRFTDRQKEFEIMNAHISNFSWSYGPDAREYHSIEVIRNELTEKVSPEIPWPASFVCNALSHYGLIEECAKGKDIITIMEDDAVLVQDFDRKAMSLIDSLPDKDFDLIQWGWNWDSYLFVLDQNNEIQKIDWTDKYLKVEPQNFRDTETQSALKPLILTFGIHCYSLTPRGAQKILDLYPVIQDIWVDSLELTGITYTSTTIDGVFNAFYPKMKAYISVEPLSYVTNDKQYTLLPGSK
jgi:GR25 family glycosyltransferase involved in LPS biosynthesis